MPPKVERVPTGMPALDKILQGGFPKGSVNLLSGACGTGKTIFGMQFLYEGAKKYGEPGLYVTLEEDPKDLVSNMNLLGWDVQDLINRKKLLVIKPEVYKFDSIKHIINDAVDKIHAKRLVVDSYSVMLTYFSDSSEIRNGLVQLDREIKKMGCTALVLSDIKDKSDILSTTGLEEFIVDGVVVLYLIKDPKSLYGLKRALVVRKMRATNHPLQSYPFEIREGGIRVDGKGVRGAPVREPSHAPKSKARPAKAARPKEEKAKNKLLTMDLQHLRVKTESGHRMKWKHL
ncbi:MAG: AAA family ATPase [Candidatus Micrarchaeota archaeon]|nr:AAA family ATPase [Candidatus Micrarchaeota archaeon]